MKHRLLLDLSMQKPDPFRLARPHKQHGGTEVPGFRNPTESVPGHRLRKDLGQHFLRDERVLDDIVRAAQLHPGHRILEIGPGPGNLTARLAAAAPKGHVVAIEADRSLAAALRGRHANLDVLQGDAVQTDLAGLGRFDRIVANLPYLISGPITVAFLDLLRTPATRWGMAVLMYQKEFADRLLAQAGQDAYGRLSVHAARWLGVAKVRDVPPGAFEPPPKVDSTILRLEPHAQAPFQVDSEPLWRAVVDGSFAQRRKQMRNTIPASVAGLGIQRDHALRVLEGLGLASERPEQVPPGTFANLANLLAALPGAGVK